MSNLWLNISLGAWHLQIGGWRVSLTKNKHALNRSRKLRVHELRWPWA